MSSYLSSPISLLPLGLLLSLAACGSSDDNTPTPTPALAQLTPTPTVPPTLAPALCGGSEPVACEDQLILDLGLIEGKVSEGEIVSVADGAGFRTEVDATAGGFGNSADNPWIYMRFTKDGGRRVDIDDLDALESMEWDIAFKRYLIRLNGGVSGPSCVASAEVDQSYEALSAAPIGVTYSEESFYDDSCQMIADDKGLGSADVNLGAWWGYNGCVNTTGQAFVIQLAEGDVVKFIVDSYYEEGQQTCNTEGTPGRGSANLVVRWAFL